MTTTAVYRPAGDKAHFYTRDGEPVWELPNKSKGGMRAVTLADAKKLDLLPSVTTVIRGGRPTPYGVTNYRFEQWGQHLLTTPRFPEESDDSFLERANASFQDAMDAAPDMGTAIHRMIAQRLREEEVTGSPEEWIMFRKVQAWIELNVETALLVEQPRSTPIRGGFACTVDALLRMKSGQVWLADWKTQAVKSKPKVYDEWVIQLAAEEMVAIPEISWNRAKAVCANIIIPTTDYPEVTEAIWTEADLAWGWEAFRLALATYRHNSRWPAKESE